MSATVWLWHDIFWPAAVVGILLFGWMWWVGLFATDPEDWTYR